MLKILRKTSMFAVRGALALCVVLFAVLIVIQIILIGGVNALNADFFKSRINSAAADSGYHVAFDTVSYDPVRGFTLRDFSLADAQGVFLTLDRLSVSVAMVPTILRTLEFSVSGGTLAWQRMPVSDQAPENTQSEITPFVTPDIYFNTVTLSRVSFKQITLGENIAGTEYSFAPTLRARIKLGKSISLRLNLEPGLPDFAPGIPAPRTIKAAAKLNPETLALTLKHLSVSAPDYALTAEGVADLAKDGAVNITVQTHHDRLDPLTQGALKNAQARFSITGPLAGPALDATANLAVGTLKEHGLSDIVITLKSADFMKDMASEAHIASSFYDQPVTLQAGLSYEAPLLHITDIKGDAYALTLMGGGAYSTASSLFDGKLALAVTDLAHYGGLFGTVLAGKMTLDATLKPEGVAQSATLATHIIDGSYDGIRIKTLTAQAAFASIDTPWPQSAKMDATGLQLPEGAATVDTLTAAITNAGNEQYKLSIKGRSSSPAPLSFDGAAILSDLTKTVPTARDIALTLAHGGSSVKLTGAFTTDQIDLKLGASGVHGRDIPAALPEHLANLRLDLAATMTGTPLRPITKMTATMSGIGAGAYRNATVKIAAEHDGEKVTADLAGQGLGIRKLAGNLQFPMALSLLPFNMTAIDKAPLSGSVAADIELAALAPLFLTPAQKLSGTLNAESAIAGTVVAPAISGTLRLSGASFEDSVNGIIIAKLAADARFTPESLTLTTLSATDGASGTLGGNGTLSFGNGATDIALRIRNFNIPRSDFANGVIGGDLSLKGSGSNLHLTGSADIAEMRIFIPETFESRIPQLNIIGKNKASEPSLLDRLALDITINAPNQVFVRGWGLDAEFGGKLTVSGTAVAPQVEGTLSSRRGRYEELGKRFTLARAQLRFQGAVPPSPYLDIQATTPAGDVTAAILLTGSVQAPKVSFSSTPALPNDEVLSRILFGRAFSKISPLQAVQLTRTIQRFSGQGGGGIDPLDLLRSATGIDDISFDTDESGAASVDVGKYLTDKVYLEVGKGKAENSGAATIQIELTPSINIQSRIGQDAQGGGGIFWKRDY